MTAVQKRCGSTLQIYACLFSLLALTACGSGPELAGNRAPGLPVEAPTDGMIVYKDPNVQTGISKRRQDPGPVTQIYTTSRDQALVEDLPVHTYTGTVVGVRRGEPVPTDVYKRMLSKTHAGETRVLSPSKFKELWSSLETAGLFRLPALRDDSPPTGEAYFLVKLPQGTWIFPRPALSRELRSIPARGTDPASVDPGFAWVSYWRESILALRPFMDAQ